MKPRRIAGALTALLAAVGLCGGMWSFAEGETKPVTKLTVTPEEFGGYPSDGEDDTEALLQALATGKTVQLSGGVYEVSAPLSLTDQTLIGAGTSSTVISSSCADALQPILQLGGRCTVSDIVFQFEEKLIQYTERQGERVAIRLGNGQPADGSQLRNLRFVQIGTALYAPDEDGAGVSRLLADTLFVGDYGYRAVDFRKSGQYGNTFSNLYIGGRANLEHARSAGFAVEGEEFNLTVEQLNLEHYFFDSALLLKNCHGARFGSIHMEASGQSAPGTGLIRLENSDAFLEAVTLYYNPQDYPNCGVIELGTAGTSEGNYLEIGTLHLKGLNNVHPSNGTPRDGGLNNPNAAGFKTICRGAGATGTYTVKLGAYVWYTWYGDSEIYAAFPCDENGIRYLSKGVQ